MIIRNITTNFEDSSLLFASFGMTDIFGIERKEERGGFAASLLSISLQIVLSFRPKRGIPQKTIFGGIIADNQKKLSLSLFFNM